MSDTGDPFIGEDDLETFEGWCRYQAFGEATTPEEMRAMWEAMQRNRQGLVPLGRMSLGPLGNDEFRCAVALEESDALCLALWIKRSAKGDVFVFYPRSDRKLVAIRATTRTATITRSATARRSGASRIASRSRTHFAASSISASSADTGPRAWARFAIPLTLRRSSACRRVCSAQRTA